MSIYYSSENNSFYDNDVRHVYESSSDGWPSDAVEITQDAYDKLLAGQAAGKIITSGKNRMPVLQEPVITPPSLSGQLAGRIKEADAIIQPLMGYALAGILSDAEKETFKAWNEYRKALEGLDVTADEIEWPDKPE